MKLSCGSGHEAPLLAACHGDVVSISINASADLALAFLPLIGTSNPCRFAAHLSLGDFLPSFGLWNTSDRSLVSISGSSSPDKYSSSALPTAGRHCSWG